MEEVSTPASCRARCTDVNGKTDTLCPGAGGIHDRAVGPGV